MYRRASGGFVWEVSILANNGSGGGGGGDGGNNDDNDEGNDFIQ